MPNKLTLPYAIVDSFATEPFTGNPAAVVLLSDSLPAETMQNISTELNKPATAFIHPLSSIGSNPGTFFLRWFTPAGELPLCGHATLATGRILSLHGYPTDSDGSYNFHIQSGDLLTARVLKDGDIELDFPADTLSKVAGEEAFHVGAVIEEVAHGHVKVAHVWRGSRDYVVEVSMLDGAHLKDIDIDINTLTKTGGRYVNLSTATPDGTGRIHSRHFAFVPDVHEDIVTGSAHCSLAVLWSSKFGGAGTEWKASQGNAKQRTGALRVIWDGKLGSEGGRVRIIGSVVQIAEGNLLI